MDVTRGVVYIWVRQTHQDRLTQYAYAMEEGSRLHEDIHKYLAQIVQSMDRQLLAEAGYVLPDREWEVVRFNVHTHLLPDLEDTA